MPELSKIQMRVLECALDYAEVRGWHILPVSKGKKPLIAEWSKRASTNDRQIVKWWQKFPSANIGVLTGPESGFWVVDTDNRDEFNGLETLSHYFGEKFTFNTEKYLAGKTPTGGVHLLFQWDDDYPVKTKSNLLNGVDTRGVGGQIVVAPSSRFIDGSWEEYRWNNWDNAISPMQPWTYDLIKLGAQKDEHDRLNLEQVLTGLPEGERDEGLNRFAWLLRTREIPYELAIAFVTQASRLCKPVFDERIAVEKVERAYTTPFEPKQHAEQFQNKLEDAIKRIKSGHS